MRQESAVCGCRPLGGKQQAGISGRQESAVCGCRPRGGQQQQQAGISGVWVSSLGWAAAAAGRNQRCVGVVLGVGSSSSGQESAVCGCRPRGGQQQEAGISGVWVSSLGWAAAAAGRNQQCVGVVLGVGSSRRQESAVCGCRPLGGKQQAGISGVWVSSSGWAAATAGRNQRCVGVVLGLGSRSSRQESALCGFRPWGGQQQQQAGISSVWVSSSGWAAAGGRNQRCVGVVLWVGSSRQESAVCGCRPLGGQQQQQAGISGVWVSSSGWAAEAAGRNQRCVGFVLGVGSSSSRQESAVCGCRPRGGKQQEGISGRQESAVCGCRPRGGQQQQAGISGVWVSSSGWVAAEAGRNQRCVGVVLGVGSSRSRQESAVCGCHHVGGLQEAGYL